MANLQKQIVSGKAISSMEELFESLKNDAEKWDRGLSDDQLLECMVVSACRLYVINVAKPPANIDTIMDLITVVENKDS